MVIYVLLTTIIIWGLFVIWQKSDLLNLAIKCLLLFTALLGTLHLYRLHNYPGIAVCIDKEVQQLKQE